MDNAWIKRLLVASRMLRLAGKSGVAILTYHSVLEEPQRYARWLGSNIHSAEIFRRQMEFVARHYTPVTLDDVLSFLRGEKNLPPRAVAVTFDDGHADNFEIALPILNHVGVRATFYLTVDCIANAKLPWFVRLRHAFGVTERKSWEEPDGTLWPLKDAAQRESAFLAACDRCARLAGTSQEDLVRSAERELETETETPPGQLMMTWDQARGLLRSGHAVGSHGLTHPNLAYVSESELNTELAESKRKLEQELATQVVHFAYPGPALKPIWSQRSLELSRQAGYQTAVISTGGLARRQNNPLCLPRVGPGDDVDGLRWNLECTFLGRRM
jgi:peptidoglycan/xylan/chitin deacetylase (PgdA/CDA1 family)